MNTADWQTRRNFLKMAAAGAALASTGGAAWAAEKSRIHGVYVGMQTFTLRGLGVDGVIAAMSQVGLDECELWSSQAEPKPAEVGGDLGKWRATVSLDYFTDLRKKFNDAGIEIYAYNPRFGAAGGRGNRGGGMGGGQNGGANPRAGEPPAVIDAPTPMTGPAIAPPSQTAGSSAPAVPTMTDEEIDRLFQIAKALGATTINSRISADLAPRVAQAAERHKMIVGITSQEPAILAASPYFRYDVDTAAVLRSGHDPLEFIQDNFDKLSDVHLNDTKAGGPAVPMGQGDAKIKEVLLLMKKKKSKVRALIDSNYAGSESSVDELKKEFDYVNMVLA
jgi:TAT (twin-arginine translocation) pathway signal sequence